MLFPAELHTSILVLCMALGFGLLLVGGWLLVDGAVRAAERMNVSKLVLGLTVVAFGTSSPELFFNIFAALEGNAGLAYGNVVGSNIANIGLVIGLSAMVTPVVLDKKSRERGLRFLVFVSFTFAFLYFIAWLPTANTKATAYFDRPFGIVLLLLLMVVGWFWVKLVQKSKQETISDMRAEAREEKDYETKLKTARDKGFPVGTIPKKVKRKKISLTKFIFSWFTLFGGLALLLLGGWVSEKSAERLASNLGMTHVVIGVTVVAIATTLPEIITCLIAAYKKHSELIMGTVIGSNLCNILLVMGVTCIIEPVPLTKSELGNSPTNSLFVMLVFTVLLWFFAMTGKGGERSVSRTEGALLVGGYVITMAWLVNTG